jgi:hypothetical protein
VAPMPLEVSKERAILIQPQILAHHLHREHFTIGQSRLRAALPQSAVPYHLVDPLVNPAKPRDNEHIQVHLLPPLAL